MSGLASVLGAGRMRAIARVNKRVTNPIVAGWAGRSSHMAVVEHVGRRSGRRYRTPVMVFVSGTTLRVVLNYGARSDWVRNVLAAQGAGVRHRGRRYRLIRPRVQPIAASGVPLSVRSDDNRFVLRGTLEPCPTR
ncbi:nitroreductase family deazaflavin-dependent oxidoreductase [Gordonia terrae]|uniref:nitroreductase family deazaflavin-dependent oxidoreductase n=1 Tax=Gordonia terrae TaxID=2055 RepID=UPI003F6BE0DB